MWKRLHVKCPLFLSDFNETWIFSTYFRKKAQISSFIKICPVAAELFHADRQTGTKLTVALRNFANAPNKSVVLTVNWAPKPWVEYTLLLNVTSAKATHSHSKHACHPFCKHLWWFQVLYWETWLQVSVQQWNTAGLLAARIVAEVTVHTSQLHEAGPFLKRWQWLVK
jgi:hypothetical protein